MKAFMTLIFAALAASALSGCNHDSSTAAAASGSSSGSTASVQGLSTPKSIAVVTAK
jgi:hypothetical protein